MSPFLCGPKLVQSAPLLATREWPRISSEHSFTFITYISAQLTKPLSDWLLTYQCIKVKSSGALLAPLKYGIRLENHWGRTDSTDSKGGSLLQQTAFSCKCLFLLFSLIRAQRWIYWGKWHSHKMLSATGSANPFGVRRFCPPPVECFLTAQKI